MLSERRRVFDVYRSGISCAVTSANHKYELPFVLYLAWCRRHIMEAILLAASRLLITRYRLRPRLRESYRRELP